MCYDVDFLEEYINKGVHEGCELFKKVSLMTKDKMWMRSPRELCDEEILLYETMFSYAVNDIMSLSQGNPIIAEGAGFMPGLVKGINIDKFDYICIVPTKDF